MKITYEQTGGKLASDGEVLDVAMRILRADEDCVVSSGLLVDAIRLMVKESINEFDVEFVFRGELLPVNRQGRLPHHPWGFADACEKILCRLIS